jgi:hypothetical protein
MTFNLGLPELTIIFTIILANLLWLWAMVHCALNHSKRQRAVWIVIIALTHVVGALVYFFLTMTPLGRRLTNTSYRLD